jgi:hypothetical protein
MVAFRAARQHNPLIYWAGNTPAGVATIKAGPARMLNRRALVAARIAVTCRSIASAPPPCSNFFDRSRGHVGCCPNSEPFVLICLFNYLICKLGNQSKFGRIIDKHSLGRIGVWQSVQNTIADRRPRSYNLRRTLAILTRPTRCCRS